MDAEGGLDETRLVQIVAGKTPGQIEELKAKFQEKYEKDLYECINDETGIQIGDVF